MMAGYSPNNKDAAAVTASRLMDRPRIKEAIAALARHHMGSRGSAISMNALIAVADDPTHPQRVKAAAKIWDWVNPPTLKVEHNHNNRNDEEMERAVRSLAFDRGIPPANLLGYNRVCAEMQREWDERWGHETPEDQFERLCLLAAELGPRYAKLIFGPRLTQVQEAKLQRVLDDPRNVLKRLPPIIDLEAEPVDPDNPHGF
jgi:hypothetical protein